MANYEYCVVPFIGQIKGSQNAAAVSAQLQGILEQQSKQGWELDQVTNVNIEVKPGCLAGLFGAQASYVRFDQIIFRKQIG